MLEIGLTGGIGSGKSTVATMLADRGAVVLDSDSLVRELQVPGTPVFEAMVAHWGDKILAADGTLDRGALAAIVFEDPAELKALTDIVHPAHAIEMERRRSAYEGSDAILVFDIPLLVEVGRGGFDGIVVVDLDPEIALERLVAVRGLDEADARSRMANQASRNERLKKADFVVDNAGSMDDLIAEVNRCWEWITTLSTD
ncbi:MAG: dephospho-CoA kinase [Acidimicrobiia bacterium]|nr:dephospho-CoA kinase [Actinomycetota bacterium]MBL6924304.1 dephospho-CoA kinase [Acidimicrobiia bacterium]MBL6926113.1 dephospho-CoA kinase [Acidimicrobiia bacterium]